MQDGLMSLSLYLHIPFCRHRCSYCDFNTYTTLGDLQEVYADALCREIAQVGGGERRPAHTLFLGGGTPSLMPAESLLQILTAARAHFQLLPEAEITMEANPDIVDEALLVALYQAGVNRLSLGMQSGIPTELALLEREHGFEAVAKAVRMARRAGFENINLDLIYGLPGQSLASWEKSLHMALSLLPEHLSLYCLTIEAGTPVERRLRRGQITAPDPDLAAEQYRLAGDLLAERGFVHYEISNWALPGRQCEHNLTYWRNEEYLGLGAGAHGHAASVRYQVVKQPRVYIRRLEEAGRLPYPRSAATAEWHQVTPEEAMSDTMITQLRLLQEGVDLPAFAARFGRPVTEAYPGEVERLEAWGLLRRAEERLLLTEEGRFLSNQVFYRFV